MTGKISWMSRMGDFNENLQRAHEDLALDVTENTDPCVPERGEGFCSASIRAAAAAMFRPRCAARSRALTNMKLRHGFVAKRKFEPKLAAGQDDGSMLLQEPASKQGTFVSAGLAKRLVNQQFAQ